MNMESIGLCSLEVLRVLFRGAGIVKYLPSATLPIAKKDACEIKTFDFSTKRTHTWVSIKLRRTRNTEIDAAHAYDEDDTTFSP